ncbi:MAG: tetratricopeptide repeat protein [Rubrivivax sp.]|nr:tetratricopeptide repeat protein [Pyrinomonadaceae bacterium]
MANARGKIFCQRCKAANGLGEELCARCGTRLMLVVAPSASRFEAGAASGGMEEHLLERITAIESNITRLLDRMQQMADLLLRQNRSTQLNTALIDALADVLDDAGVIPRRRVTAAWRERYRKENGDDESRSRGGEVCENIIKLYKGEEHALFTRLVREGFAQLERGKAGGFRSLERAAALAADNVQLNNFLGAHYFSKGRTALARDYFSRALDADPENWRVRLLLGLACGDEGEPERARELLSEAVRRGGPSFAAHCALGRLSAAESDWKTALAEFKCALAARACPEAHYLLGLVNYRLGRDRTALKHLAKAVGLDASYGAAFYLSGLIHLRLGERERAAGAFDAARSTDKGEPLYRVARRNLERVWAAPPPSLFVEKGRGRRRLVTGGDDRLAAALQADALGNPTPR